MSSKVLPFLLGLGVGVGLAFVVARRNHSTLPVSPTPPPAAATSTTPSAPENDGELATARQRVADLERRNGQLAQRVQQLLATAQAAGKLSGASDPAATNAPTDDANPIGAMAKMFGGKGGEAMRGFMKSAMEQQMAGRITAMKTRLNLTPEQEHAIRAIYENQQGIQQQAAEKMLNGQLSADEMAKLGRGATNPDEAIKALLSPEQQTAYDELKKDEANNNARLIANAEMLQMQQALGLNQDQQDRLFTVLVEQARGQMDVQAKANPADVANAGQMLRQQLDRKLEALQKSGILNDEQLSGYRQMQESQLKMIESFLPKVTPKP